MSTMKELNKNLEIVIINYEMGNLRSVYNKLNRLNINCKITSNPDEILCAKKIILPGVGHFSTAYSKLKQLGLIDVLHEKILVEKVPILGICLGMQLFCKYSEEGDSEGLGWIDAEVVRFRISDKLKYKIPHMGWNKVKIINSNFLDAEVSNGDEFYFVHSYHVKCNNLNSIWMTSCYEYEFVSAIHKENIYGIQFHPEKSHDAGLKILRRFLEL